MDWLHVRARWYRFPHAPVMGAAYQVLLSRINHKNKEYLYTSKYHIVVSYVTYDLNKTYGSNCIHICYAL